MELHGIHGSSWPRHMDSFFFLHSRSHPENYVHWTQTPDSHLFSADLPGLRKEDIRVELEDSRYLVIRTELSVTDSSDAIGGGGEREGRRSAEFRRKFRLPEMVDIEGISAIYEDGVLTIRVPRTIDSAENLRHRRIELTAGDITAIGGGGAAPAA